MLIVVALSSLLIIGIITLFRLITRNKHTDLCKRQIDQLRQVYKDQFDTDGSWAHYDLFPPRGQTGGAAGDRLLPREYGGLAFVVSGLNAVLLTAAVAVLTRAYTGRHVALNVLVILGILIGAFTLQAWYVRRRERQAREESRERYPEDNRAGGVVYRTSGGGTEYLLVRPKGSSDGWVLPKGHIQSGESHVRAAVREVAEEAGVAARPLGLVGRANFKIGDEDIRSKFYLMEWIGDLPTDEARGPDWFSLADAFQKLHPESQEMLRLAEQRRLAP